MTSQNTSNADPKECESLFREPIGFAKLKKNPHYQDSTVSCIVVTKNAHCASSGIVAASSEFKPKAIRHLLAAVPPLPIRQDLLQFTLMEMWHWLQSIVKHCDL